MKTLTADGLGALLDAHDAAQLVDVLSPEHYAKVHLPGARNLPLKQLPDCAPEVLDADRPVVVYCSSPNCGMSPEAAQLLDDLGFTEVCDFEGGIVKWRRSGRTLVRGAHKTPLDT